MINRTNLVLYAATVATLFASGTQRDYLSEMLLRRAMQADGRIHFVLPQSQCYEPVRENVAAKLSAAAAQEGTTPVRDLCQMLTLRLSGHSAISGIELETTSGAALWGEGLLSFHDNVFGKPTLQNRRNDRHRIQITCTSPVQLSAEPRDFFFIIPVDVPLQTLRARIHATDGSLLDILSFPPDNTGGNATVWTAAAARTRHADFKAHTAVISDIHLSDRRAAEGSYGWFSENRERLLSFFDYVIRERDYYREMVIAGDLFEEWVAPMDTPTFADGKGRPLSEREFLLSIAETNRPVIERIKAVKAAGVDIVYVPGNHDMLVTAEDIDLVFGPGTVTQYRDAEGLGLYRPDSRTVIEHGHRYDFFNAPDPVSNLGIDGVTAENAILPQGFFISKYTASSRMEFPQDETVAPAFMGGLLHLDAACYDIDDDLSNEASCETAWQLILGSRQVKDTDCPIRTGAGGLTGTYSIQQISSNDDRQKLYRDAYKRSRWADRLAANQSPYIPFTAGFMASISDHAYQYIAARAHPADTHDRLVVFGHTHTPELKRLESSGQPGHVVYANPGSWVDHRFLSGRPNCTFVEIYNGTGVLEGYKQVALKQFHSEEDITDLTDPVWLS